MERKRAGERECCWRGRELFGLWNAREGLAGVFIEAGFKVSLYNKLYIYLKQKSSFLFMGMLQFLFQLFGPIAYFKSNIYKGHAVLLCYLELYCFYFLFFLLLDYMSSFPRYTHLTANGPLNRKSDFQFKLGY